MSTYVYNPVSKSEIRLVTIKSSGLDGQKLELNITNVELNPDKPITYTAVSYCWGNAAESVKIPCDGMMISVTTSLHEALLAITKFSPDQALWIDQICINQGDVVEKSDQVSKMNLIYDSEYRGELDWLRRYVKLILDRSRNSPGLARASD